LAFGGAGLAAALATANNIRNAGATIQSILALVGILYFELTIVSLILLIVYMLQARYRYPYLYLYLDKIGNAWPFFYYASRRFSPRKKTRTDKSIALTVGLIGVRFPRLNRRPFSIPGSRVSISRCHDPSWAA